MAWIPQVPYEEATGPLRREYDARLKVRPVLRSVITVQSLNTDLLRGTLRLAGATLFGDSELPRADREMIGIVTSMANDCHY